MKAIQVMFDERLLKLLDSEEEVRKSGRSAVLRRAAAEYLERREDERITEAYRRGYANDGSSAGRTRAYGPKNKPRGDLELPLPASR